MIYTVTFNPSRFITNHSSGKMGYALARAAMHRGAEVTVVQLRFLVLFQE